MENVWDINCNHKQFFIHSIMNKYRENVLSLLNKYQPIYTPQYIKTVDFELGIDEAGRGPVFGSMIYSALWWPIELKAELSNLGFNDSKVLTEQQRDSLLEIIDLLKGKILFYSTKQLTAEIISTCMNNQHQHTNLNELSHNAALQLCREALSQGFKVTNIYADTVGDPGKYTTFLRNGLQMYSDVIKNIVVQPKADRDHKVVSASSICAKVTRDRILKQWKFPQNIKFQGQLGSGYPGDPKTKQWLVKNKDPVFGYPNLVRFSWNTTTNALQGSLKVKLYQKDAQSRLKGCAIFQLRNELYKDLWNFLND